MAPLSMFQVPSPSPFLIPTSTPTASGSRTPTLPLSVSSSWISSHPSFSAAADTDPSTDPAQTSPASTSPGTQRGANYFFGFLITFVALLLIFVGCGVGSRRRYAARRRAVMAAVAARPPDDDEKPRVWDVWVRPTRNAHVHTHSHKHTRERGPEWNKITPLAARTVHPEVAKAAAKAAGASASTLFLPASVQETRAPTPVLVEPPLISLDLLVPEWILRRREMRAAGMLEGKGGKGGKEGKGEDVGEMRMQVTVLVAMPTQRHGHRQKVKVEEESEGPGHVEIGVTSVPWRVNEDEDEDDGRS